MDRSSVHNFDMVKGLVVLPILFLHRCSLPRVVHCCRFSMSPFFHFPIFLFPYFPIFPFSPFSISPNCHVAIFACDHSPTFPLPRFFHLLPLPPNCLTATLPHFPRRCKGGGDGWQKGALVFARLLKAHPDMAPEITCVDGERR